eukprot:GFYU01036584.1.p1 GENE.GFYU01036584.1~~GFYU01036584.1.p1  ORF type:complete len:253 (+),score=22.73 GFYU01036584.1:94-759(+)
MSSTDPRINRGLQHANVQAAKTTVDANGNVSSTDPVLNRQYQMANAQRAKIKVDENGNFVSEDPNLNRQLAASNVARGDAGREDMKRMMALQASGQPLMVNGVNMGVTHFNPANGAPHPQGGGAPINLLQLNKQFAQATQGQPGAMSISQPSEQHQANNMYQQQHDIYGTGGGVPPQQGMYTQQQQQPTSLYDTPAHQQDIYGPSTTITTSSNQDIYGSPK